MIKFHTTALTAHLRALEQKEADSPRRSRCQEIIKLRVEINKIETKKTIQRINETKSCFFEKINNIDKSLSKLIKRQRENIQINKIRNEKGRHNNRHGGNLENHQVILQKGMGRQEMRKVGEKRRNGKGWRNIWLLLVMYCRNSNPLLQCWH